MPAVRVAAGDDVGYGGEHGGGVAEQLDRGIDGEVAGGGID